MRSRRADTSRYDHIICVFNYDMELINVFECRYISILLCYFNYRAHYRRSPLASKYGSSRMRLVESSTVLGINV